MEAAHIIDIAFKTRLEKEFPKDNTLPLSANDGMNGLLLCGNCHGAYDSKPPLITISEEGVIKVSGNGLKMELLKKRNGKKASWANNIDQKDYPSKSLLKLRLNWKICDNKKRKRDMDQESDEAENDEEPKTPNKKAKIPTKKAKTQNKKAKTQNKKATSAK